MVIRFYASDALKIMGPGGPAAASYNIDLTDVAVLGPPTRAASTRAYFRDHIVEPGLAASPDGAQSSHTLLEVAGHPAIEFVELGPHFTTRSIDLALNDHQDIDVVSTDLTQAQLVQVATGAVSG